MSLRLHPGERILFEGHPSWRAMLGFYLKAAVAAVVFGLVIRLAFGGAFVTFLAVLTVLAMAVALGILRRLATTYTVTDRRLHIRRGLISREIQETRLSRVRKVNYRQGLYQRLLRIGDVEFDTASVGEDYDFVFMGLADPAEVVHRLDGAGGVKTSA